MGWLKEPLGSAVQLNSADPGKIFLTSGESPRERSVVISLAYADEGGNPFHLTFSADAKFNGLVYKLNTNECAWDVSDIAQIEPVWDKFVVDSNGPRHGVIALDESGARLIGCNNHQSRGWFDLSTWDHAKSAGIYRVCFPEWRLVVRSDQNEPAILFEWPPKDK